MTNTIYLILISISTFFVGFFISRFFSKKSIANLLKDAKEKNDLIIKEAKLEAENIKKEKIFEAKEKYIRLKSEFEENINKKKNNIIQSENRIKQKEQHLSKEIEKGKRSNKELDELKEKLTNQIEIVNKKKAELEKYNSKKIGELEKISNLSAEEAVNELMETLKIEAQSKATLYIKDIVDEAKLSATKKARKIVIDTIQRTATENTIENCVSIFNLENDDVKGKIIGREGRNIRALEAATGVEIVVDDTPEAIIISGFDPVRREIARLSLHRLVTDGRIHAARIEEIVAKTKKNIEDEIIEIGERNVIELGIHGLHPELIKMVGRMRFRSSYGQNLLQHSREVANLCATMASEIGLNPKQAKRAGLLHDIGKVWTEEAEKPHAIIGMELAQKYNEKPHICNAIGAHHDEIEMTSLLSPIVQVCDAMSGARPGARREIVENYIKRLKDLEAIALSFDGVNKCYAIQAGRELRVIVDAEKVSDDVADNLSFDISQKVESEVQYPGQIKVTVIRETRSISFAK